MHPTVKKYNIPTYFNWFKFQRIPSHSLSYVEWGDPLNENVVLCIHGLTRNARDFDKLAQNLAQDFRVISLDIVGRGQSDWFENKLHYHYDTYIKDVLLFIEGLTLKNINFIGTSMGGIISYVIAAQYPNLVKTLTLNDIGPYIPASALKRIAKYVGLKPEFDNFEAAKAHCKILLSPFGIKEDDDWNHITKHSIYLGSNGKYVLAYDAEIVKGMNITPTNVKDVNLWNVWNKVNCPTLIVRGEKSDILTVETSEQMLKSKKDIKLYTAPNVGHAPALMDIDQINVIKTWLHNHKI